MIVLDNVKVAAGTFTLANLCMRVPTGSYAVLMGKTGCGKTTLLEAICGLRRVLGGSVQLMERDVTRLKPAERGVGLVPQDRALFNSMSVREHLAFALEIRHWTPRAIDQRVDEMAEMLGIGSLLHRKPHGLSGGEAQRVALGRALSVHPKVLLLDEPLSALDSETRAEMHELLHAVRDRTGVTTLHITHDQHDAERLADLLFVLKNGVIKQVGEPAMPTVEYAKGD